MTYHDRIRLNTLQLDLLEQVAYDTPDDTNQRNQAELRLLNGLGLVVEHNTRWSLHWTITRTGWALLRDHRAGDASRFRQRAGDAA